MTAFKIYEAAFSLETSDIITDSTNLFFSNNKNQFFSVDLGSGSFSWENKVNSNLRPTLVGNYLFTISIEGYLVVIEKNSGNIIRVTDIFNNFKPLYSLFYLTFILRFNNFSI